MLLNKSKPLVMGILNITPDSFADGGKYFNNEEKCLEDALQMEKFGAAFIDIGAESSRPGSLAISAKEEIERLEKILPLLLKNLSIPISLDTYKPEVTKWGLDNGVKIINDITGFINEQMIKIVSEYKASCIIMHMLGNPQDMQANPKYEKNVSEEVFAFLKKQSEKLLSAGVKDIAIDPGIGFGKTLEHNLTILREIKNFSALGLPVLLGTSRKAFIGNISDVSVENRLPGTIAVNVFGFLNGVSIFRVHDVKEAKLSLELIDKIMDRK
ncbi:MAG: dihydropteroate synthase [Pseudomonadota bacterium]